MLYMRPKWQSMRMLGQKTQGAASNLKNDVSEDIKRAAHMSRPLRRRTDEGL